MRKLLFIACLFAWQTLITSYARAASYWIAPSGLGGSDSNNGLSQSTPWLTPNHSVNCGDVITAVSSSSYLASNFSYTWGTVTCATGNNVAWVKCATFDSCKISSNGTNAMALTASYWGVQGWELTTKAAGSQVAACVAVAPPNASASIHHIVIANMICNGAAGGGINTYNNGTAGIDYLAIVGNAIYDAVQSGLSCYSGISLSGMISVDTSLGTHTYVGGNISWDNVEPSTCEGGLPTDGEGIILDTWSGAGTGLLGPYTSQALIDNNLLLRNGGRGITVFRNSSARVYIRYNTMGANNQQSAQANNGYCSEFYLSTTNYTSAWDNLVDATKSTGCGNNIIYAIGVVEGDTTDVVYSSFGYSASGSNAIVNSSGTFAFGPNNILGTNPSFVSTADPGAPNCGSASSVPSCMAATIANFKPANTTAMTYGYQTPSTTQVADTLFPQWLCNVSLPAGLISMGCLPGSTIKPPTNLTVVVKSH